MEPTATLIIPAYNREHYVAAALGSVRQQTREDFELIVWDDGSTDRTAEIAARAAEGDPRVRIVRAEHRGVAAALNAAARQAKGRYLGWVDSDDAVAPTALARTAAVLDARPEVGLVYTQHVEMDEEGWLGTVGERCLIPYSKERLLVDFMTFHFRLMRRDLFERVGGLDESLPSAEDYDLCLRLSEVTEVAHVAEPLYFYRAHRDSTSSARRVEQLLASRDAIERALVRRGLAGEYEIRLEIVGRYELRHKVVPFVLDRSLLVRSSPPSDLDHGLVSCVCVSRGRHDHLARAFACFQAQTYRNRELVVVHEELDEGARELLSRHAGELTLVPVPPSPKQPLGALRNLSLRASRGAYICCWDDDDWHSPLRVEHQLSHLVSSGADGCALGRWLMLDETTGRAYVSSRRTWEGSVLCKSDLAGVKAGYPPLARGEDRVFVSQLEAQHRIVTLDRPELYVYTHHGGNAWDAEHFRQLFRIALELSQDETEQLVGLVSPRAAVKDSRPPART